VNGLEQLGREIAREQDALRARLPDDELLRERIASMPVPASRSRRAVITASGAALAAAAAVALFLTTAQKPPLRAVIAGSQTALQPGAWIEAPATQSLGLRFSDGTRVSMAPRARARLVELDAQGAHLLLENGRARVSVVHKPHARWLVSAGPFVVHVTGTRFDVQWNAEQDRFELDLAQGRVEVSGCLFDQGYRMSSGQRIEASCKAGHFDMLERGKEAIARNPVAAIPVAPEVAGPNAIQATPSSDGNASSERVARTASPARRGAAAHRARAMSTEWQALARRGQYTQALAVTDFEAQCEQASAKKLAALADTARYAGDSSKEALALRLLRERYPGTPRAALAAFALGRLEFDANGSYRKAAEWFRTYLSEQAGGPLAREARGRLMEATLRSGDAAGARELAARYLRDYASGPHAAIARGLLEVASP
jgi:transmembrane sensor